MTIAIALPLLSGSTAVVASTGTSANSTAPNAPCAARAAISHPMSGARPTVTLAVAKPPTANTMTPRLPTPSSQRPLGSVSAIIGRT